MKSRENIENQRFTTFSPALQLLKMVLCSSKVLPLFYFYFYFRKIDFIMLLLTLNQVINSSNILGIHEMSEDGKSYDMIYTGQIKTKSEMEEVMKKYGRREVKEIDTRIDKGKLIYIEVKRQWQD